MENMGKIEKEVKVPFTAVRPVRVKTRFAIQAESRR